METKSDKIAFEGLYPEPRERHRRQFMNAISSAGNAKITVPGILERKSGVSSQNPSPAKITCLTAYDYPTARLLDEAAWIFCCGRFTRDGCARI